MAWKHYTDLIDWQKSMNLVDEVYKLLILLPKNEDFALSSQIRRSVISVPSNIAEGAGRDTDNNFKYFLSVARGSLLELETQLTICIRQNYFSEEQADKAFKLSDEIGKMLTKLICKI